MALAYNPKIVTDGLVLALDAANPKSYPSSGTAWYDLSGSNNTGTLFNGPTYVSSNSGSLSFDGVNDYSTVPANVNLLDATIGFWVYLDDTISWATRFDILSGNIPASTNGRFVFYRSDTVTTELNVFALFPSLTQRIIPISNAITIFTGKWKNVTITSKTVSTTTTISIYVDGVLNNSLAVPEVPTVSITTLHLMRNQNGSHITKGKLSSVITYNRALSAAEVQQNFTALRGRYGI